MSPLCRFRHQVAGARAQVAEESRRGAGHREPLALAVAGLEAVLADVVDDLTVVGHVVFVRTSTLHQAWTGAVSR